MHQPVKENLFCTFFTSNPKDLPNNHLGNVVVNRCLRQVLLYICMVYLEPFISTQENEIP